MNPSDLLRNAKAEVRGQTLIVKLPVVQMLTICIVAGIVVAMVGLKTHDLGIEMSHLQGTIERLASAVDKFADLQERHEQKYDALRDRVSRLEANGERQTK